VEDKTHTEVLKEGFGRPIKTIRLEPTKIRNIHQAIELGNYDERDDGTFITFKGCDVSLSQVIYVTLYEFQTCSHDEVLLWAQYKRVRDFLLPIEPKHLFAIGIQYPTLQCFGLIVELGECRNGYILCLGSEDSRHRTLYRRNLISNYFLPCYYGFIDLKQP